MTTTIALLLALAAPDSAAGRPEKGDLFVGEINEILEVYVGDKLPGGGNIVVFELQRMRMYSSRKDYSCIFVNGRIVAIKEYNNEDIYIRGVVELPPPEEEIVAYCGAISHREQINPHDHAALWKAFVTSPHKPFRGKVKDRPKWWVNNPIKEKYSKTPRKKPREWSSYPRFTKEEIPALAEEALSPKTGKKDRFYIVWGLAISGYTPASAEALAKVACDDQYERTTRSYAAMGLRNFTGGMTATMRDSIRRRLRKAFAAEGAETPDALIRTLLTWGDAAYVAEVFGAKLSGHSMEIEVLQALPGDQATQRLWEMYQALPAKYEKKQDRYIAAGLIARALAERKDKRGIDILMNLLPAGSGAPHSQYRHNHFAFLAGRLGVNFGYPASGPYRPQLEQAVPKMLKWWQENRETFDFDAAPKMQQPPPRFGPPRS